MLAAVRFKFIRIYDFKTNRTVVSSKRWGAHTGPARAKPLAARGRLSAFKAAARFFFKGGQGRETAVKNSFVLKRARPYYWSVVVSEL